MLDKVPAPELIATTVESSVLPYAEEHEIPLDELLLQYIKVNFDNSVAHWEKPLHFLLIINVAPLISTRICWSAVVLRLPHFSLNGKPKQWLCRLA